MRSTVSFNNSGGFWESRLSFVSSCMAWINARMISSPISSLANTPFWKHDHNSDTNNSFYGKDPVDSGVSVSFNSNPSANKIYKALSVESPDYRSISGNHTFIANNGTKNAIIKEVTINRLVEKGGILYGNIPEQINKTFSNIEFLGVVTNSSLLNTNLDLVEAFLLDADINESILEEYPEFSTQSLFYVEVDGSGQNIFSGSKPYITHDPIGSEFVENTLNTICFYNGGYFVKGSYGDDFFEGKPLYAVYQNQNGEQPKGQFADVSITFGSEDFEVYSINVDYEPTNLDHNS